MSRLKGRCNFFSFVFFSFFLFFDKARDASSHGVPLEDVLSDK